MLTRIHADATDSHGQNKAVSKKNCRSADVEWARARDTELSRTWNSRILRLSEVLLSYETDTLDSSDLAFTLPIRVIP
jgi:hypothetical protein